MTATPDNRLLIIVDSTSSESCVPRTNVRVNDTALHHKGRSPNRGDILQRISIQTDDVSFQSWRKGHKPMGAHEALLGLLFARIIRTLGALNNANFAQPAF
jgi:hypothetical protein